MFIKSYLCFYFIFLSCAILASSHPIQNDPELNLRGLDVSTTDTMKRDVPETAMSNLVRKMVEAEIYVRSLFDKRSQHRAAKQVKVLRKQNQWQKQVIQKLAAAQGKEGKKQVVKAQKTSGKKGKGSSARKAVVNPSIKAKNSKKKSAALPLQAQATLKVLVFGAGALMMF